jgi:Asp-tRNA(Asn)/Glu-tRNA(Gln) amidotransferase A subunit family amidase
MAHDFDNYLRRLGRSAVANSLLGLKGLLKDDPFADDKLLGSHPKTMPILRKSLEDPSEVPDLGEFLTLRQSYLRVFNAVMRQNNLDLLIFPQVSEALPGIFDETSFPATTVSEINIAGLPGVTVPAGQFANGSPFSLIFVGRMWSEVDLLAFAYDYEQATHHHITPDLVEDFYPHHN